MQTSTENSSRHCHWENKNGLFHWQHKKHKTFLTHALPKKYICKQQQQKGEEKNPKGDDKSSSIPQL